MVSLEQSPYSEVVENVARQPRDFSLVTNIPLRQYLTGFSKRLMLMGFNPEQMVNNNELIRLPFTDFLSDVNLISQYAIYGFQSVLRINHVIPYHKASEGGKSGTVLYDIEEVFAIAALAWQVGRRRATGELINELKINLGNDPIRNMLLPPNKKGEPRITIINFKSGNPDPLNHQSEENQEMPKNTDSEKDVKNGEIDSPNKSITYLKLIGDPDLIAAKGMRIDTLQQKAYLLKARDSLSQVSAIDIPRSIMRTIVIVSELNNAKLRDPEDILEELCNKQAAQLVDLVLAMCDMVPSITNLGQLLKLIERKINLQNNE